MLIFPAIDIFEGKAVRLYKGDYNKMTVYSEQPSEAARGFEKCGAEWVHLVDLEGAKDGNAVNFGVIKSIVDACALKCEVGGGIRTEDTIKKYIDAGVQRVILGTAALEDRGFLEKMCGKYAAHIAVGADIMDGQVAVKGWTSLSGTNYKDFCADLAELNVKTLICTDISRDGAMEGTNAELYAELSDTFGFDLIASGGVSSMEDVERLRALDIYGAIIGKALYTGAVDLKKAIEAAR